MVDARTRLARAQRLSQKGTATDKAVADEAFAKTNKEPRIEQARVTAEGAATEAQQASVGVTEALRRADAGDLGYLHISELFDSGRLGDTAVYNSETRVFIPKLLVRDAQIGEVAANKITAGTMVADLVVGNRVKAAGAELTPQGVTLASISTSASFPSQARGSWLTPRETLRTPSPYAGVGFFQNPNANERGVNISASGEAGTAFAGLIRLAADAGEQNNDAPWRRTL